MVYMHASGQSKPETVGRQDWKWSKLIRKYTTNK